MLNLFIQSVYLVKQKKGTRFFLLFISIAMQFVQHIFLFIFFSSNLFYYAFHFIHDFNWIVLVKLNVIELHMKREKKIINNKCIKIKTTNKSILIAQQIDDSLSIRNRG